MRGWSVGRSVVGCQSVGPQYILLLTLISYTPLRYVRNVARENCSKNISPDFFLGGGAAGGRTCHPAPISYAYDFTAEICRQRTYTHTLRQTVRQTDEQTDTTGQGRDRKQLTVCRDVIKFHALVGHSTTTHNNIEHCSIA